MSATQSRTEAMQDVPAPPLPVESATDRWLARFAILALPMLALALWYSYGTSIFFEMAAGFWALCF